MSEVECPGCGEPVARENLVAGKRFECENCAGLTIEVSRVQNGWELREVCFVSCPECEAKIEVPANAKVGEAIEHCGKRFQLSFEFGTWSLG